MTELPAELRKSLTWDRGMELASHKDVSAWTGLDVYFADPRSPWQRGTNENTNRLLRQYFPKGMSMAVLTQDDLDQVAVKLNTRPRKTLGYDTRQLPSPHCCCDRLNSHRSQPQSLRGLPSERRLDTSRRFGAQPDPLGFYPRSQHARTRRR